MGKSNPAATGIFFTSDYNIAKNYALGGEILEFESADLAKHYPVKNINELDFKIDDEVCLITVPPVRRHPC